MSKVPTAFDLLKLAGRKRLRPSQNAEKEVDAPRKKQAKVLLRTSGRSDDNV